MDDDVVFVPVENVNFITEGDFLLKHIGCGLNVRLVNDRVIIECVNVGATYVGKL